MAVTGMASNISVEYIYITYLPEVIRFIQLLFEIGYIHLHTRTPSRLLIYEVPSFQTSNWPVYTS